MKETLVTTCALDCWDACSIVATVEDGKIVSLAGSNTHPITQSFLCGKTQRFAERVYDPNRILHPLKKTQNGWEKISWNQALDEIAAEIQRLQTGPGMHALFHLQSAGSMGIMKKLSSLFFNLLGGVSVAKGDICLGAGERAMTQMLGGQVTHAFEDLPNSKLVILWGRNPYGANIHLVPFLRDAKKRGGKVILIDPVTLGGSGVIDWHIRPRPGSDFLLVLAALRYGVVHGLVGRRPSRIPLQDWEPFEKQLRAWDAKDLAKKTGLANQNIERFCKMYWEAPSASIWMGSGLQHHENGVETVKLFLALGAVSGNLGISGGGVSFYQKHRNGFRTDFTAPNRQAKNREIPVGQFPALFPKLNPKIEMIWINGANPVAAMPGSRETDEAIRSAKTVVVVDTHMTDTARCATHFLPTTTFLEEDGIVSSWGQNYIGKQRRIVAPQGESKTDLQIFQELSKRLGFGDALRGDESEWEKKFLPELGQKDFMRNEGLAPVPFADGKIPTASGKFIFPNDIDLEKIPFPEPTSQYPFHLITPKPKAHHLSQITKNRARDFYPISVNPSGHRALPPENSLVKVRSKSGEIRAKLVYDKELPANVAVLPLSGTLEQGNCANLLTGDVALTQDPACPAYYSCFVSIQKVD